MSNEQEMPDWTKPIDGVIAVPDELDGLVKSMLNQYGFHKYSELFGPEEMVCRMAYAAQKFFARVEDQPAKEQSKLVEVTCMYCEDTFKGEEPKGCCSGRDCGCMGMPIYPVVCSEGCYEMLMKRGCISAPVTEPLQETVSAEEILEKHGELPAVAELKNWIADNFSFDRGHKEYFTKLFDRIGKEYAAQFTPNSTPSEEWISVKDRLPDNYTSILVVGRGVRSTALFDNGLFHSDFKLPQSEYVTHWMPLPSPPIGR